MSKVEEIIKEFSEIYEVDQNMDIFGLVMVQHPVTLIPGLIFRIFDKISKENFRSAFLPKDALIELKEEIEKRISLIEELEKEVT